MRETIDFKPGTTVTLALEFRRGRKVRNGMILFLLTENRMMYLEPYTAWKVFNLRLESDEPFTITKLWNGVTGPGCITRWDVNRVSEPVAVPVSKVVRMPFPVPALASTGTEGPRRVATGGNPPISSGKIPLDVAFREALRIVNSSGVVWGDVASSELVCAILEAAAANGWLAPWERDAA